MESLEGLTDKLVALSVHEIAVEHFSNAKTDEDFIKASLKMHLNKQDELPQLENIENLKSDEKAKKMLDKVKQDSSYMTLEEMVEAYNNAMVFALPGSQLLAHAFANRSIVLTNAGMYGESLKDIEHALKANYPENMKALLFARKAKNILALDPTADIEEYLAEARRWALKMDEKERTKLLKNLEKIKTKSHKKPVIERDNRIFVPMRPNDHPLIKDTSSSITVNYSEKFGRHIVATRDMIAGEVLSVKRAYATIVSCDHKSSRCWNCSKHCWSSVPCDVCSNVIYCNEECRNVAWKDFHDVECHILNGLLSSSHCYEDISLMSLRLLIKAIKEFGSVKALYKSIQKIDQNPQDFIMETYANKTYDDMKYTSVYPLCRKPMDTRFQVQCALKALQYMYIMSLTSDIFGKKMKDITELANYKYAIFIGKLLFHHTVISSTNMSAIYGQNSNIDEQLPKCGGVINPLESLYNHSCDPNVAGFLYLDMSSFMTLQPIKKGEQLFISYGQKFIDSPTLERREELQKIRSYWCDCVACTNDWHPNQSFPSVLDKLPEDVSSEIMTFLCDCTMEFHDPDFYNYNKTSIDKIKKILTRILATINTLGALDIYPNEETSLAKILLYNIINWIAGYQS